MATGGTARCLPIAVLLVLGGCGERLPDARGQEIVLCYRTLAEIDCRSSPDPGHDARLVGVYLRPAPDPRGKSFWLDLAARRAAERATR